MAETVIYGASDDLIEVEGGLSEEFSAYDADGSPRYLAFSDGTVLRITYGERGCWEIRREFEGTAGYHHQPHDNDDTRYSDRVTLSGDLKWVVCGEGFARATAPRGAKGGA